MCKIFFIWLLYFFFLPYLHKYHLKHLSRIFKVYTHMYLHYFKMHISCGTVNYFCIWQPYSVFTFMVTTPQVIAMETQTLYTCIFVDMYISYCDIMTGIFNLAAIFVFLLTCTNSAQVLCTYFIHQ